MGDISNDNKRPLIEKAGNRVKGSSFKDYVAQTFENQFWEAAEGYLNENLDSLNIDLYRVHKMGEFEIESVNVEHVWTDCHPSNYLEVLSSDYFKPFLLPNRVTVTYFGAIPSD